MNTEDDLAEWLAPRSPSVGEPTVEDLFHRTRPVLRPRIQHRWLGRVTLALTLLGVGYGAGFVTAPTETVVIEVPIPAVATPEPPPVPIPPTPAPPEPSAEQLELQAELSDDPAEVAALFRKAGDKYLNVDRDYPRATRCYRMHLLASNEKSPQLQPDDTWLLASLKPR